MHVTFPPSFLFKKLVSYDKLPGPGLLGQRVRVFLWLLKQQADRLFPERLGFMDVATSHRRAQGPPQGSAAVLRYKTMGCATSVLSHEGT